MSLWPVLDKATALLMERFFDNLARGFGFIGVLGYVRERQQN
ncbi:CHAT domain-containing protein [[Phormidium] sp. LEGE 05292]|nr:CHAT domain-containing protein [Phormidium sp. LEGE 05292]